MCIRDSAELMRIIRSDYLNELVDIEVNGRHLQPATGPGVGNDDDRRRRRRRQWKTATATPTATTNRLLIAGPRPATIDECVRAMGL